jgi:hypothetical protein
MVTTPEAVARGVRQMEEFAWAENNLDVASPQELQGRGVNVYHAPQIAPETKVVDLSDGRVTQFADGQARPDTGLFANFEGLERYCRKEGLPLGETNGQASVLPRATGEAGDPLAHGEAVPLTPNPEAMDAPAMGEHPERDSAGARGGDTGPSEQVGEGDGAEKGDQRRGVATHLPATRGNKGGGSAGRQGDRTGALDNTRR